MGQLCEDWDLVALRLEMIMEMFKNVRKDIRGDISKGKIFEEKDKRWGMN